MHLVFGINKNLGTLENTRHLVIGINGSIFNGGIIRASCVVLVVLICSIP